MDVMPNEFCNCHVRLADLAFSPNGYAPSKHLAIKIMPLDELGVISRDRQFLSCFIYYTQISALHLTLISEVIFTHLPQFLMWYQERQKRAGFPLLVVLVGTDQHH